MIITMCIICWILSGHAVYALGVESGRESSWFVHALMLLWGPVACGIVGAIMFLDFLASFKITIRRRK